MEALPSADYRARIAALLDALGVRWLRTEQAEACPVKPTCQACNDRRRCPEKPRGVSYQVMDGILRGQHVSWDDNADEVIFEKLAYRLNEEWTAQLRTCASIGKALRSVGR